MPSGLKRFQQAEALHFITFSCFHRLRLLEAPGARETFEAVLEQTRARHQARVYAYVLMPDHVHLLVNEPPGILLAQFLKAVKQITSRKLKGPREKFWQDRYYDSNVSGEQARSEVIRYIHRNPVKRGLVEKPEDWPWSSFRHYATGVKGTVEIESQWTAFQRGNQLPEGIRLQKGERTCLPTQAVRSAEGMRRPQSEADVD
jgi:REP-associated tyrosine transposase